MSRTAFGALAVLFFASLIAPDARAEGNDRDEDGRRRRLGPSALKRKARRDIMATGLTKYMGQFTPTQEDHIGDWTRVTYDSANGAGPICVDGSDFRVFIKHGDPKKLLIFLPGGGACWQGQYACSLSAPMDPPAPRGIFADYFVTADDEEIINPFADYSKVVLSYCDGSIYGGDKDVPDMTFPGGPVRYHRGLRNLTAGVDLAKASFPEAERILFAGASAGGYGVTGISATLVRFAYPKAKLRIFNDSGPLNNPAFVSAIQAQIDDWDFVQYYPAGCTGCDPFAQPSEVIKYWLANDRKLKAGLFSYDGDGVIRFFIQVPTEPQYRDLLLGVHDPINAAFPRKYKRFIVNGPAHTIVGGDGFFTLEQDGIPVYRWVDGLANGGRRKFKDIVAPPATP